MFISMHMHTEIQIHKVSPFDNGRLKLMFFSCSRDSDPIGNENIQRRLFEYYFQCNVSTFSKKQCAKHAIRGIFQLKMYELIIALNF